MHPAARQALIDKIVSLAEQAYDHDAGRLHVARFWGMPGGVGTALNYKAAIAFKTIVDHQSSRPEWRDRASVQWIEDRLGAVLVAAHQHGRSEAEQRLAGMVAEYAAIPEHRVFIPVDGLSLEVAELAVGRVIFRHGSPVGVEPESEVGRYLVDRVYAEHSVIAEPGKAGELATLLARPALEALTFAHVATDPYGRFSDAVLSIESERLAPTSWVGVASPRAAYFDYRRTERSWPVLISAASLHDLSAHGLADLSEMLVRERGSLSELELALLRAVHWLASAQAQVEAENRLLNLTTCLEALVGPLDHKTDPISGTMAEAVAIIIGSGYEQRKRIRAFIIDQYGERSKASHGGLAQPAIEDLRELREIVVRLILSLLAMRGVIHHRRALFEWLERTRLSGPLASPGTTRTLAELRAEHNLTFMQFANMLRISPDELEHWERVGPDLAIMRKIANALNISVDRVAPGLHHQLTTYSGHRFLLGARRRDGIWVAEVKGYDPNDAEVMPLRPVDPENPHASSPSIIATAYWDFAANSAQEALTGLMARIEAALCQALDPKPRPDDLEDWCTSTADTSE